MTSSAVCRFTIRLPAPRGLRDSHTTWTSFWGADHDRLKQVAELTPCCQMTYDWLAGCSVDDIASDSLETFYEVGGQPLLAKGVQPPPPEPDRPRFEASGSPVPDSC